MAEWLCGDDLLQPGLRVLDLGCGRAKSSVFLAREYGVRVWAADLWIDPGENDATIRKAGVDELVTPLRGDARQLPFPHGFFDVVLAFDSFQYFGTDCLFLPYVVQFLKPTGRIGFASAGMTRDFDAGVPPHLERFWDSDAWCLRTAPWWRDHWERTGLVDVRLADTMPGGCDVWLDWAREADTADWYLETLERDGGQYLGYVRMLAERRPDTPKLPYDLQTGRFV